jgi:hypothetical protein
MEPIREPLVFDIEGCSSASQALELARSIGLKSKIKSTFFLNSYRAVSLRPCMLMGIRAMPRKSGRLGDMPGSVMEYVILLLWLILLMKISSKIASSPGFLIS